MNLKWCRKGVNILPKLVLVTVVLASLAGCREERMASHMAEKMTQHLTKAHDKLKITPEQEPHWTKFTSTVTDEMGKMMARHQMMRAKDTASSKTDGATLNAGSGEPLKAIDHLNALQQSFEASAQSVKRIVEAAQPLYSALTPEQQKIADELMETPRHKMKRWWHF